MADKMFGNGMQVVGYVDPPIRRRIDRITKKSRLTMSRIVEECVQKGLPDIEKRVGINGNGHKEA